MSNEAFVTLATNDTYGLGALVLGRSLRRVATSKQTVVLVTADVSQKMKEELGHVFNLVITVDTLDSGDAAHLALMSRPELGITFTKLHAWRLVQFSKCVFLDADTLVVQNCDELFEREELSAAPDPGWPDCFNSGVFVFVPSEATFKALMDFAVAHGSFDGGDQGLLNMFFSDWATGDIRKHLPFIYNVVSSATYSYLPALKHFGSQVKIAHFLGINKPWLRQGQAGTSSPYQRAWWSIFREDVAGRLSQDMIEAKPLTGSSTSPILLPKYKFKDPWDFVRYEKKESQQCVQLAGPHHPSPDRHSQASSTRDEQLINQIALPSIIVDSFQSNKGTVSQEHPYPIPLSKTKEHSFIDNIKSFDIQMEKIKKSSNNTAKENIWKPNNNHPYAAQSTKLEHEMNVYPSMKNNPTSFISNHSFSKSMAVETNFPHTSKQNFHTLKKKTSVEDKEIKKRDSASKSINEINKSNHFSESKPSKNNITKDIYLQNQSDTANKKKTKEENYKIGIGASATLVDHKIFKSDNFLEDELSKNLNSKSSHKEKNSEIGKLTTIPNTTHCSAIKMLGSADTIILSSEKIMPDFAEEKTCLDTPNEQELAIIDNDLNIVCSISRVGAHTMGTEGSEYSQTYKTFDKDVKTNIITQQNSQSLTSDENPMQNNAGIPGVLARGEPDDWRREAWEAGDVDYLGRDSFDNIWKRICECVGITAQTLSAPAAPAATSAGIVKQPSAPAPISEKTGILSSEKVSEAAPTEKLTSPQIEKPAGPVATPDIQTVTDLSAEKQAEPTLSLEKPVELPISEKKESVEKPAEPPVSAEKTAAPPVPPEKPAAPPVPAEKPVSVEKPVEPAVSAEKTVVPAVLTDKPAETVVSPEKQAESVAEKPAEPLAPMEKPALPTVSAEKPAEPAVPADKPAEPVVLPEKPVETVGSPEKQAVPIVPAGKQAEPPVPSEKPVAPSVPSEIPTIPVVPSDKPVAPAVSSEKPAAPPVPDKSSEALPVAKVSQTVVDKEIKVEAISVGKHAQKTSDSTSSEEKSAKQEAQSVEKPTEITEPVAVSPADSSKQAEAVPTEKKAPESVPAPAKSVEIAPAVEKPVEKSVESKSDTLKPTEAVEATEVCPMKPSLPKSTAPGTPAEIPPQPTSSEPLLKSGEARIQPPLVGGDAPVCKKEPGTPTITPPSGPGSPQPADVPPEVCKLQATPSQPATPPASSHQTTDAPVPPKRKQGKNGKSGKGKK